MKLKISYFSSAIRTSFSLLGTVLGAGFISGSELIKFFPSQNFLPSIFLSGIIFLLFFGVLLYVGKKLDGFDGVLNFIFKDKSKYALAVFNLCSLCICATMLAGIDSLFFECFSVAKTIPIFSLSALILCFFVCKKGVNGINKITSFLIPIVLSFIFLYSFIYKGGEYQFYQTQKYNAVWLSLSYVGVNVFLSAPVVCDLGKNANNFSVLIFSIVVSVCAYIILSLVFKEGANAINSDMPLLYVINAKGEVGGKIFAIFCLCGILCSLFSSFYALQLSTKNKPKLRILACCLIFLLSRIGLKGIISTIYPIFSVCGLVFVFLILVNMFKIKRPPLQNKSKIYQA